MPAHLIRTRRKARPFGFLVVSTATGMAALLVSSGGSVEESAVARRTPSTSEATVLGTVLRSPSPAVAAPDAPPASAVTITVAVAPSGRRPAVRRPAVTTTPTPATPSPTLAPPVSVTEPGRTTTTTTGSPATTVVEPTTSTTEAPATTETTAGEP